MNFLKKHHLLFAVFLTGASVLVVEVLAVRILSPYYGNTIFTVSSVIGVVLSALSIGYYFGGKLADRYPIESLFYLIIFAGGLSMLLLQAAKVFFLPILGNAFSLKSGPFIASLVFFFLPSFLLALLSPFAIKLQMKRVSRKGLGAVTGKIFFWSTAGSISGSFVTGFLLIPHFGVDRILSGTGLILIATGLTVILSIAIRKRKRFRMAALLFLTALACLFTFSSKGIDDRHIVYQDDGVYEKIFVYDDTYNGKPARFLQQDRSASGAMFLGSDELAYDYTKYYALYKIFNQDIANALFIGGGAYSMPKALLRESSRVRIDVAEIEPSLFHVAKKFFNVPNDARLKNHVEDGRRFLKNLPIQYDLIFSDVYYSLASIPMHFATQEFFEIAYQKLTPNGVFIGNFIGNLSRQQPSLIFSEMKTFQTVFSNSYFFAVDSPGSLTAQNIIFFAYKGEPKIDFASLLTQENLDPLIRSLPSKSIDSKRFDLSPYPIFTDDYAPVEYVTGKMFFNDLALRQTPDGDEMMALIAQQLRYGPRFIASSGHKRIQAFLLSELDTIADQVVIQQWKIASEQKELDLMNIVARFHPEREKRIILGTHYDSKKYANRDIEHPGLSVPGANDSASGVSVLIEVARVLAKNERGPDLLGVDIVFFDGEEGLLNDDKDWYPLGSTYFAEHLSELYPFHKPLGAVIIDMVCAKNLRFLQEKSSLAYIPKEVNRLWDLGKAFDQKAFPSLMGLEIHDDHTPLNLAGIPSFLLIDFDYPPFHTTRDTLDKCSAQSLETVAHTLLAYLSSL